MKIITAIPTMENTIISEIKKLGIDVKTKNPEISIEEISRISFKRDIINGPRI